MRAQAQCTNNPGSRSRSPVHNALNRSYGAKPSVHLASQLGEVVPGTRADPLESVDQVRDQIIRAMVGGEARDRRNAELYRVAKKSEFETEPFVSTWPRSVTTSLG